MPLRAILPVLLLLGSTATRAGGDVEAFETALHDLAAKNGLPGLSAGIVEHRKLVWSSGFGHSDGEARRPATPATPYRLASLSKPFAAVLLMQLVGEGKLDLDAPMRDFTIHGWFEPGGGSWAHYPERYADGSITVRHVLTHTSQADPPGQAYAYSGNIFADLTWVVEQATGQSYPRALQARVLDRAGLKQTAPGHLAPWSQEVVRAIATPFSLKGGQREVTTYPGYGLDPDVDVSPWDLKPDYRLPAATQAARRGVLGDEFTPLYSSQAAAGMISTIEDLARFDAALDAGKLLDEKLMQQMFSPARTTSGAELPYALGWFVQSYEDVELVWHYGWYPPSVSALYLKVPERDLTFLLLSNSDGLSANLPWTAFGAVASPYARLFLEHFVPKR